LEGLEIFLLFFLCSKKIKTNVFFYSSTSERLPRTPIINTRYGKIQGRIHTLPTDEVLPKVEVYHGIPYATPPVTSNR